MIKNVRSNQDDNFVIILVKVFFFRAMFLTAICCFFEIQNVFFSLFH